MVTEGKVFSMVKSMKSWFFAKKLNDFAVRRLEGYLAYKWGASANLQAVIHLSRLGLVLAVHNKSIS